jgi:hypothetical protein
MTDKAIVDCEHKKKNPHKYRVGTPFYAAFFAYKSAKHDPESLSDGDIVDRTIAAYEAANGDGWLPISEAPRDGTRLSI